MRTCTVFQGDHGKEIIVFPSITPNPDQKRIGIHIGGETVWLRHDEAMLLAEQIKKEG